MCYETHFVGEKGYYNEMHRVWLIGEHSVFLCTCGLCCCYCYVVRYVRHAESENRVVALVW